MIIIEYVWEILGKAFDHKSSAREYLRMKIDFGGAGWIFLGISGQTFSKFRQIIYKLSQDAIEATLVINVAYLLFLKSTHFIKEKKLLEFYRIPEPKEF